MLMTRNYEVAKDSILIQKSCQMHFHLVLAWAIACLMALLLVSCVDSSSSNQERSIYPFQADPMDPWNVKTMVWQNNDYLWIGNRAGVARVNRNNGNIEIFDDIACPLLFVTPISEDVWCSTVSYVNKYDGVAWKRFDIRAYQIIEGSDGTIWAGTKQGLARFDETRGIWENVIKVSLEKASEFTFTSGSGIHLSFQASDGALWFYSYSNSHTGTTRWTEISQDTWLPAGDFMMVQPMLETQSGMIWGGGDNSVVSRWDGQSWQVWRPFRVEPAILDIIESQNGDIWVLAVVDGVGRWNSKHWQVWSRDEDILQSCPGIARGHKCFSDEPDAEYYPADGIGHPNPNQQRVRLTTIVETQDGQIWVGTAQEGVSRWNGNEWRNYTMADGLSSEAITVLTESPDAVLWAGTWGGGVNFYNPETDRWQPFP